MSSNHQKSLSLTIASHMILCNTHMFICALILPIIKYMMNDLFEMLEMFFKHFNYWFYIIIINIPLMYMYNVLFRIFIITINSLIKRYHKNLNTTIFYMMLISCLNLYINIKFGYYNSFSKNLIIIYLLGFHILYLYFANRSIEFIEVLDAFKKKLTKKRLKIASQN